jgi:hypothetical protein
MDRVYIGKQIGDYKVLQRLDETNYICECRCGVKLSEKESTLLAGGEILCSHQSYEWEDTTQIYSIKRRSRLRKKLEGKTNYKIYNNECKIPAPDQLSKTKERIGKVGILFLIYCIRAAIYNNISLFRLCKNASVSYSYILGVKRDPFKFNSFAVFYAFSQTSNYPLDWGELNYFHDKMFSEKHSFTIVGNQKTPLREKISWLAEPYPPMVSEELQLASSNGSGELLASV